MSSIQPDFGAVLRGLKPTCKPRGKVKAHLSDDDWLEVMHALDAGNSITGVHEALTAAGLLTQPISSFVPNAVKVYKGWRLARNGKH